MKTKRPTPKRKAKNTTGSPEACQQRPCSPRWVSLGKTWLADVLRIYQEMDAGMRSYTAREMGIKRIDFYSITRDKLEHWSWEGHGIRRDKATLDAFAAKHGHADWAALKQWLRREHEMSFHGFVVTWANAPAMPTASDGRPLT